MDNLITFCIPSVRGELYALPVIKNLLRYKKLFFFDLILICNGWAPSHETSDFLNENSVSYRISSNILDIDTSHCYAISTVNSKYVYLVGDDDFLTYEEMQYLSKIIFNDFDLVVFDVNSKINKVSIFKDFNSVFPVIHNKCTLGNILVKHSLYNCLDKSFQDTAHWYTSFFGNLIGKQKISCAIVSISVNNPLAVKIKKTYLKKIVEIYLINIPKWYKLLICKSDEVHMIDSSIIIKKMLYKYYLSLFSFRFLFFLISLIINRR